ncbi:MAG: beta-ketoacyl synthase N-terminal-like domain-containing protein [Myxococcota bacterium]
MSPIAIVGQACVLPDAPDARAFARNVLEGRDSVRDAEDGRWGLPMRDALGEGPDRAYSAAGGYVDGFRFDPTGLRGGGFLGLDPLVLWLLSVGRDALADAGIAPGDPRLARAGAIFGNLSFPSAGMSRWGEDVILARNGLAPRGSDPRNALMSGLPADLLAGALGLGAPSFAIDAACASSLYAIKLACDALNAGRADLMLAGAVQRADNLFLHVGFCRLGAMSKTGTSRPFHVGADGLVPAEGCALVVLKRLADVRGERVLGVIRGIGLANDARARNLLAPSEEGQARAIRAAYGDVSPADVQLVECHATGTPTGDRTEIASMAQVFRPGTPIGSLKSQLGHLITTAGAAGLMKVLAGFAAKTMPPTLHAEDAIDMPFSPLVTARNWDDRKRRAAVSAFGFGGNNAHLVVEEAGEEPVSVAFSRPADAAIVGMAVRHDARVPIEGLRFPPNDLKLSLAQQTMLFAAALDAVADAGIALPRERTAVLVGMGADAQVTGYGLRWRLGALLGDVSQRDAVIPALRAENVVGTMPNIPANRLNIQLDVGGPSFTVSAEELSGVRALEIARDALAAGEIDVAIVGAVDVADVRTDEALRRLGGRAGGDAAVVFVLAREGDARAWITDGDGPRVASVGGAHAASGLLDVAAAVRTGGGVVEATSIGGQTARVVVRAGRDRPLKRVEGPTLDLPVRAPEIVLKGMEMQQMGAAPRLPAVGSDVRELGEATAKTPRMRQERQEGARGEDPVLAAFTAQRAAVVQAHRAFLESQAQAQRAFGESQARSLQMVAGMGSRAPAVVATPPSPTPPPAARGEGSPRVRTPATSPAAPPPSPPLGDLGAPLAPLAVVSPSSLPGPKLSRADLVEISRGPVSKFFGPGFAPQDAYARVVRMPEPPLLLADRVLGIAGEPLKLGKGTIWTETDVSNDAWYLHDGRIPGGVMIEAGQADLLLASWQGIDVNHNRGERIYRLLGCTLRYHGDLPAVGETLKYDIHVDGHAKLGDIRMFFFHYDCRVGDERRLTVRDGQAGFFSDADLADSGGILWDAGTVATSPTPVPADHRGDPIVDLSGPLAEPLVKDIPSQLSRRQLEAVSEGRLVEGLGPAYDRALTHTHSPRIAGGKMLLLQRIDTLDPDGGPWKRGYLRASWDVKPDDWFFEGHFFNDPCMPGTLMFEGCLQAMQVYLTAMGFTLRRDGWRFQPMKDVDFKLKCRGQVLPTNKQLTYELFVQEVGGGARPYVKAQVLCTIDGLKCFHADPIVLEMVPDWPMTRMDVPAGDTKPVAWDYRSLLACAWGKPSDAFGPMYTVFDSERRCARLPGPPYHFMSRVLSTKGEMGACKAGAEVVVEYDVPPDVWYFDENGNRTMPFAVLLEAALQPCGWLASWIGSALTTDKDLLFRNLDGTGTLLQEIPPDAGTLTTHVKVTSVNRSAGMIIESFDVRMEMGGRSLYELKTVFGFFPPEAFENQVGVGSTEAERAWLAEPNDFFVDLRAHPDRYFAGKLRMPGDMLMMPDRVTGRWDDGRWRAEKTITAAEWCFKAHFYSDPVQPGSLGIESMIQLLQFAMIHEGVGADMANPRFEALALGKPMTWKYRGQVTPDNALVHTEVIVTNKDGNTWTCDAHLWVDGKRIYSAKGLSVRVVDGPEHLGKATAKTPRARQERQERNEGASGAEGAPSPDLASSAPSWRLGGSSSTFVLQAPSDHCPTYVLPALPMSGMAMLALTGLGTSALQDGQALRWLTFPDGPRRVDVEKGKGKVTLSADGAAFFTARASEAYTPDPPPPLADPRGGGPPPYDTGELFHGPAFHVVERVLARGDNGATLLLRPASPEILLDGATHGVPHDRPELWAGAKPGLVAYPLKLRRLALYGAPPRGPVRCEVRWPGDAPRIEAWFFDGDRLAAHYALDEVLLPKGRLGAADPAARRDFLRGAYVEGVSLSKDGQLTQAEVRASDWLPGTIERVYGTTDAGEIARRELAATHLRVHPRALDVFGDRVIDPRRPLAALRPDGFVRHDFARVSTWWRAHLGKGAWPGEDVVEALAARFLGDVVVHDPDAMEAVLGRPCLYCGNHQNYLESVLFSTIAPALFDFPLRALAKVEHRGQWLGELHVLLTRYPGQEQGDRIVWFDQADPASLPALARAEKGSLLVHVEGTRVTEPGQKLGKISSLWVDLAVEKGLPIVPVAFRGGVTGGGVRHDVPPAPQDHHVGRPLLPDALAALPYAERRKAVADAVDALGVPERAATGPALDPRAALGEALGANPVTAAILTHPGDDWARGLARLVTG